MKIFYSLNIELVSSVRISETDLDWFKSELEKKISNPNLCEILYDNSSINFNNFLEIYVEDFQFEFDIVSEIEELIKNIDELIEGGWSTDSKIEFFSNSPRYTILWYKEGNVWKEAEAESRNEDFFLGEDEQEYSEDSDLYDEDFYDI